MRREDYKTGSNQLRAKELENSVAFIHCFDSLQASGGKSTMSYSRQSEFFPNNACVLRNLFYTPLDKPPKHKTCNTPPKNNRYIQEVRHLTSKF